MQVPDGPVKSIDEIRTADPEAAAILERLAHQADVDRAEERLKLLDRGYLELDADEATRVRAMPRRERRAFARQRAKELRRQAREGR